MKYAVETANRRVERQIERLPREVYPRVRDILLALEETPRPIGAIKVKDDIYRVRVGDYRIIYHVDDYRRLVIVAKVARRKENTYRGL
mgnify:CR=1 FL=1